MKKIFDSFTQMLFPNLCICCSGFLSFQEKNICTLCHYTLPKFEYNTIENSLQKKFWGRLPVAYSFAYLAYKSNNNVQKILRHIKYQRNKSLGFEMGKALGEMIFNLNMNLSFDYIIPVPLHSRRLKSRGYNQAEIIANGVSSVLNIPLLRSAILRIHDNTSQTSKSRFERHIDSHDIFINASDIDLEGKHILIVDDVITTGSTLISCGSTLLKINNIKLSLASLAVAI